MLRVSSVSGRAPVAGPPINRVVGTLAAAIECGRWDVVAEAFAGTKEPTTGLLNQALNDYLAREASLRPRFPGLVPVLEVAFVARRLLDHICEADELVAELEDFNDGLSLPLARSEVMEIALCETRRFSEKRHG